ncbi:MAG TPA: NAD(P)-dependent alcohol dehydrogenase [Steroidobacteraceae bacterium]|jgi:NADPH:quinone reductase-like Zn-dependent oxidoreductase|nr:NAD(P)-dependent alcohol dehydrogenase [Steroidobacteraceae bacterium]
MRLRNRIIGALVLLLAAGLGLGALALRHDSPCAASPVFAGQAASMQAIVHRCYGPPAVLRYEDIPRTAPGEHEVQVRVHAASVNPLDWHYLRGAPYVVRLDSGVGAPTNPRLGVDFSGTVAAVGAGVTRFKPGDEVFGGKMGAFAQYVNVRDDRAIVLKPANVTFEQAAAVPIAAITALQALRDKGRIQAGQKVLINGASGGVGTFAVQIAKAYGAEVTGVCSTRNLEMVRALGATQVIDYTQEDFTKGSQHFDLILDTVGNHSLLEYRRVLNPHGTFVIVGGPSDGNWVGPLMTPLKALLLRPFVSQKFLPFLAELNQQDLSVLGELMQTGKLTSAIDRRYPLRDVAAALAYLEQGHARGKVVIDVE